MMNWISMIYGKFQKFADQFVEISRSLNNDVCSIVCKVSLQEEISLVQSQKLRINMEKKDTKSHIRNHMILLIVLSTAASIGIIMSSQLAHVSLNIADLWNHTKLKFHDFLWTFIHYCRLHCIQC